LDSLPKEPFAEYMISKGCDPKDGYKLLIPVTFVGLDYLPEYVRVSSLVFEPMIIELPKIGYFSWDF